MSIESLSGLSGLGVKNMSEDVSDPKFQNFRILIFVPILIKKPKHAQNEIPKENLMILEI